MTLAWAFNNFGRWRFGRLRSGCVRGFYLGPIQVYWWRKEGTQ